MLNAIKHVRQGPVEGAKELHRPKKRMVRGNDNQLGVLQIPEARQH